MAEAKIISTLKTVRAEEEEGEKKNEMLMIKQSSFMGEFKGSTHGLIGVS